MSLVFRAQLLYIEDIVASDLQQFENIPNRSTLNGRIYDYVCY